MLAIDADQAGQLEALEGYEIFEQLFGCTLIYEKDVEPSKLYLYIDSPQSIWLRISSEKRYSRICIYGKDIGSQCIDMDTKRECVYVEFDGIPDFKIAEF